METKFRIGTPKDANGTSLRGYIFGETLANLKLKLGEPTLLDDASGDGKVTCEWIIIGEDGTVATVYDWKMGLTPEGPYDWHVGGETIRSLELIASILNNPI